MQGIHENRLGIRGESGTFGKASNYVEGPNNEKEKLKEPHMGARLRTMSGLATF